MTAMELATFVTQPRPPKQTGLMRTLIGYDYEPFSNGKQGVADLKGLFSREIHGDSRELPERIQFVRLGRCRFYTHWKDGPGSSAFGIPWSQGARAMRHLTDVVRSPEHGAR